MDGTITLYRAIRILEKALRKECRGVTLEEGETLDMYILEAMSKTQISKLPRVERSILLRHGEEYLERRIQEEKILNQAREEWYEFERILPRAGIAFMTTTAGAGGIAYALTSSIPLTTLHATVTGSLLLLGYTLAVEVPGRHVQSYRNLFVHLTPSRKEIKKLKRDERFSRDRTEMYLRQQLSKKET